MHTGFLFAVKFYFCFTYALPHHSAATFTDTVRAQFLGA